MQIKPDHPERYIVVKGDTLWDIASRFLKTPWLWPRIWKINESIKNPHLIYPGDVILLRYVDGKPELTVLRNEKLPANDAVPEETAPGTVGEETPTPAAGVPPHPTLATVKIDPKIYNESLDSAIPTISPEIIVPFLSKPLVVGPKELEQAGYVTTGLDDRIALGNGSEFYARGLGNTEAEYFHIFRKGPALKNPDSGEVLAYEATYLGDAQRLENGDPTKLVVTSATQEILPTDRLMAAPQRASLPYYFPHAPSGQVKGRVISALNAVAEIGSHSIVALSVGQREGVEDGHVLRVLRHVGTHKDPVTRKTYKLPDEESALVLVFRTFEKVSYGLILDATRPVHIGDTVSTP
ncbi:MAG: LysM peptidoglycan-binding domain-containing protein [Gammaproteobacteria bacterium]|nr:LysM peptidoglycan-binding domain-containing protein [Gammaproteobacteria bacterium]